MNYDDVLKAADEYRFSQDATVTRKARLALENAITNYAQYWANEQNKALQAQCEARNKEQNSLEEQRNHNADCCVIRDEKIKVLLEKLRLIKEVATNAGLYDNPMESIKQYAKSALENTKIEDPRDKVLEAARLLCANLRHGGHGHMTLVENFEKFDDET